MSIKEKLLYLVRYYNSARHCGHTNSILFGMKRNPKAMMLTIDAQGMRQLKHRIPEMDVVTINELDKLNGLRRPLTIDAQGMRQLKHRIPEMDVVTLNELDKLNGLRRPLTIDNHALVLLFSEALEEINRLERNAEYLPVILRKRDQPKP